MIKDITWGSIPIIGLEDENYNKFSLLDLAKNDIKKYGAINSKNMRGLNNPIHKMKVNPSHRPEVIEKIVQKTTGQKRNDETKLKISKSKTGKKATNETKLKMSKTRKGVSRNIESVKKGAASNTGKKRTEEQKKHFSLIRKGVPQPKTSETNSKMNSLIFVCPHCQREIGGRANFIRFHNDNCKMKN